VKLQLLKDLKHIMRWSMHKWKIKRAWNKICFCNRKKDHLTKLHTVIQYPNIESLQASINGQNFLHIN